MKRSRPLAVALAAFQICVSAAWAREPLEDPLSVCDRAAAVAETTWQLPSGLLSAIGIVESGRADPRRARPVPWPWTVNFDGRGYYLPSKQEAVEVVKSVRAAGRDVIDVGCFQINLFYHPEAFASTEDAFDPGSNAQAAGRILARARFNSTSWDFAVASYHSASPVRGAMYLRQVQAAWPLARMRDIMADVPGATLRYPLMETIRVMNAADVPVFQTDGLPRVLGPQTATGVLQWTASPPGGLPVVLMPPAKPARPAPVHRFID
jgi:hypothetical protein